MGGGVDGVRSEEDQRQDMATEARRIECWARTWASTYRHWAYGWAQWNTRLVLVSATLAAVAGATGVSSLLGSVLAGLIALGAAVVSGAAGALGAARRATEYNSAAAANSGLADAARVFQVATVRDLPIAAVREQFEAVCKRRDAVVGSAPVSGRPKRLSAKQLAAWPVDVEPPEGFGVLPPVAKREGLGRAPLIRQGG